MLKRTNEEHIRWSKTIGAGFALLVVTGLLLVLILSGAKLIQLLSFSGLKEADWADRYSVQAAYTASTILNVYYILSGIVILGFFFLMENRLITTGVPRKLVLRRTSLTLGIELLILAIIQASVMAFLAPSPVQIGLAGIELLSGIGLVYLGRSKVFPIHSSRRVDERS
jgi:hypothetical protein